MQETDNPEKLVFTAGTSGDPPFRPHLPVIGYLDDTSEGEMYSTILVGMLEVASREGFRLLRFGYDPGKQEEQTSYQPLLSMIRETGVDGLIFLGWTRAGAMYNRQAFFEQLGGIPLLSLGSEFSDIPHVMYQGDVHIQEMVRHLIHRHGYRRIAYMPPERPDSRIDAWRRVLRENDLLFPELEITEAEWGVSGVDNRSRRFLQILLDERNLALDAIVSSGHQETEVLFAELGRRHVRIPEDIALTGYVDTDFERYTDPGITTIDYPWAEMGEVACRQMVHWIRTGQVPGNILLPGRMLIRGSCGCVPELIHTAAVGPVLKEAETLANLGGAERKGLVRALSEAFPYPSLDFDALLDALVHDVAYGQGLDERVSKEKFIQTLSDQLEASPSSIRQARLETLVMRFRATIMPWLMNNSDMVRMTGWIFRKAQRLLLGVIAQSRGNAGIHDKHIIQALRETNQALMATCTPQGILDALFDHLANLQIPSIGLVLFHREDQPSPFHSILEGDFSGGEFLLLDIRRHELEVRPVGSVSQVMHVFLAPEANRRFLQILPLMLQGGRGCASVDEGAEAGKPETWTGYVVFEPGPVEEQVYLAIVNHLQTAMENTILATGLQANEAFLGEVPLRRMHENLGWMEEGDSLQQEEAAACGAPAGSVNASHAEDGRPLCLGFLDENGNEEYHSVMLEGIFAAAARHQARVVRIGHFMTSDSTRDPLQVRALLDFAHQFRFDGVLFLGWARCATMENEKMFLTHFSDTPLFSVGSVRRDIPSAFFDGTPYLEELLLHLIIRHGCRRVAYIEPAIPDSRTDVYQRIMRQRGLSDPALFVEAALLAGLSSSERGRRSVEILLDGRDTHPDAIMSLFNVETEGVMRELFSRGIRVPGDMAVTSFEDGELSRYESPAYTTVMFPWKELGRVACDLFLTRLERMRRIPLDNGGAPASRFASVLGLSSRSQGALPMEICVPGRVILRESCGCQKAVLPAASLPSGSSKSLQEMTDREWVALADRAQDMVSHAFSARLPDFRTLVKGFRMGLQTGNHLLFLHAVDSQIELFQNLGDSLSAEEVLDTLHDLILPHADRTTSMMLATEDMFMQAQALLAERELRVWGEREQKSKRMNRYVEDVGQAIIRQYDLDGLLAALTEGLRLLEIPACMVVLSESQSDAATPFQVGTPVFRMVGSERTSVGLSGPASTSLLTEGFLNEPGVPDRVIANLLHAGSEVSGCVLYGAGPVDERIYRMLSSHISTAIAGMRLKEKLERSSNRPVEEGDT